MPPNVEPPVEIAPLFEAERARLLRLLEGLGSDDWRRPTPCPEWSVFGLACHLLGNDLGLLARRRDHSMATPPPEGLSEDAFIDWLDELQREWVRATRRLSPRLAVELLRWTGPRVAETLADEDPSACVAQVSWAGPQPVPVWLDQLRELSECWIHRQQLLEAVGDPPELDPDLLRPILLGLRWAYPYRLSHIPSHHGDTIRIRIGDPITETWFLVAEHEGWTFHTKSEARIVATASLTADQAWRLLTNNLPSSEANALDFTGDERPVNVLRSTRAIIGHPQ